MWELYLRTHQTDKRCQGAVKKVVSSGTVLDPCPHMAMLVERGNGPGPRQGLLFRILKAAQIRHLVNLCGVHLGLDAGALGGHSLRRTGATLALAGGGSEFAIKQQGIWLGDQWKIYVENIDENAASHIAGALFAHFYAASHGGGQA